MPNLLNLPAKRLSSLCFPLPTYLSIRVIDDIIKQIASNNTAYKTLDNDFTPCYAGIMEEAGTSQPQPLKLTSSPSLSSLFSFFTFILAIGYAEQNILTTGHLNILFNENNGLSTVNDFGIEAIKQCLYPSDKKCTVTLSDGTQWDKNYTDTVIHLATRRVCDLLIPTLHWLFSATIYE